MTQPLIESMRDLFAGDGIFTPISYKRVVAHTATLADEGYAFTLTQMRRGCAIKCTLSPLKTTADGLRRAMQS